LVASWLSIPSSAPLLDILKTQSTSKVQYYHLGHSVPAIQMIDYCVTSDKCGLLEFPLLRANLECPQTHITCRRIKEINFKKQHAIN
jgi:hypothetical protein